MGTPTSVRESPAEAVDAGIVFDRHLLLTVILTPDKVFRFDLDLVRVTMVQYLSRDVCWDSEPTHFMMEWESEELEAALTQLE